MWGGGWIFLKRDGEERREKRREGKKAKFLGCNKNIE